MGSFFITAFGSRKSTNKTVEDSNMRSMGRFHRRPAGSRPREKWQEEMKKAQTASQSVRKAAKQFKGVVRKTTGRSTVLGDVEWRNR